MKKFYVCSISFALSVTLALALILVNLLPVSAAAVSNPDLPVFESVPVIADSTDSSEPIMYAAAPPTGTEFDSLAYFDISCDLGDIRLYLPYGVDLNSIQLQGRMLYNVTNSTIYLYCPDYPDTTFQAARFQNVTYRHSGTGYQTQDLSGVSIQDTQHNFDSLVPVLLVFCCVCILFFVMWRRKE